MVSLLWKRRVQGRKIRWILSLVLGVSLVLLLFRSLEWDEYLGVDLGENPPLIFARDVLLPSLVNKRELPKESTIQRHGDPTLIYVLGGSQESLKWRLPLAASIYHRVPGSRIVFLSVQEITEYSPVLGRNYTHDEWVTHVMMEEKVPATDIEGATIPSGYFGTLGEARWIADLAKRRHAGRLILVTSRYHTRRVLITFSRYLNGRGEFYIYGSDEKVRFYYLMEEYIKVLFYRYLLIPLSGERF